MPDYANGKIYKIWSPSTGLTYIGSTTQSLARRLAGHRDAKRRYENGKHHNVSSYPVLDCEDCRIDLIEAFPCDNKTELNKREGEYIVETECINKRVAGTVITEHGQSKKEAMKIYLKKYHKENKEVQSQKRKVYYKANKDTIKVQQRAFREQNKERLRQDRMAYREANKEKICERKRKKGPCSVCGCVVNINHMARHQRTAKCQSHIKTE